MEYQTSVLSNGIKIIHIQSNSAVAHCGFFINTGSRDELPNEHGVAHFIEHLLFKGTKKRKAFHVLSRLEDVGGELNAYTTKEDTCIHASFLNEHFARTFELISDIVFQSTFPDKAIASEKDVILDEINSYKDSPSDQIFDNFDERIFKNHPLGKTILGTTKSLKKIQRDNFIHFIQNNYHTDQMVLSSTGNVPFSKIKKIFERYFSHIPTNIRNKQRVNFTGYQPFSETFKKNTFQVNTIIGNVGYSLIDPKRMGLHLLSNIIGGPGMISRLNLALRERYGYSYNVESSFTPFTDTGLFSVYFSCDKDNLEKCIHIIEKEFHTLRNTPLGISQLKKAKQQIIGQLAISFESNENQMLSLGKSLMIYDKIDAMEEIFAKIEAIKAIDLMDIANEILDSSKLSTLIYK